MKIIRYRDAGDKVRHGAQRADGSAVEIDGDIFGAWKATDRPATVRKLLAPVAPPNVLCIGLNYRFHAQESGAKIPEFPVLFMKNTSAVQNPGDPIVLPRHLRSDAVDYECELAIVIGKTAKNVSKAKAFEHILGYTCANDVSARDWQIQRGGGQFCKGKSFDTFAPLGPCIVTTDELRAPNDLRLRTILNGEILQDATTADMIFDVPTLIEFLSGDMTLLPGTVILTGTPHGVGFARKPPVYLRGGDEIAIEIDGIGKLVNPVVEGR